LFAVALLAHGDTDLAARLEQFRQAQTEAARAMVVPPPAAPGPRP
jgi:5-(carboxyamino)imidazole ribonucleotide mutase